MGKHYAKMAAEAAKKTNASEQTAAAPSNSTKPAVNAANATEASKDGSSMSFSNLTRGAVAIAAGIFSPVSTFVLANPFLSVLGLVATGLTLYVVQDLSGQMNLKGLLRSSSPKSFDSGEFKGGVEAHFSKPNSSELQQDYSTPVNGASHSM